MMVYYDIYFETYDEGAKDETKKTRIEAIKCIDYINGPYWSSVSETERQDAIDQIQYKNFQYCPNIDIYHLSGAIYS